MSDKNFWLNLGDAVKYARSTSTLDGGGAYYVTSQAKENLREQGKEEKAREIERAEAIGTVGGAIAGLTLGKGVPALMRGVKAFRAAHPIISGALDIGLTVDGVRNALSDNGVKKTINYAKDGNWGRAAASGTMDALDLFGGIGLVGDMIKGYRYIKSAPNVGKVIFDILPEGIAKRGIEGLMRQSSRVIPDVPKYIQLLKTSPKARKFILTGKVPKEFKQTSKVLPVRDEYVSTLFGPYDGTIPSLKRKYADDMIDAYLYGKQLNGLMARYISTGQADDFGPLQEYITKHYDNVAAKIPVYDTGTPYNKAWNRSTMEIPEGANIRITGTTLYPHRDYLGQNALDGFVTSDGQSILNVAGHTVESGIVTINGVDYPVVRGWDIWKFNPEDYAKKWITGTKLSSEFTPLKLLGVQVVDAAGTPIITRTGWAFAPGFYPPKSDYIGWAQDLVLGLKQGGSIHIKKKNKGKFTDYCGGKVTEECIRKGKNSSNPTTRKRANFAWVARHKFKHEDGGKLNYLNLMR